MEWIYTSHVNDATQWEWEEKEKFPGKDGAQEAEQPIGKLERTKGYV